VLYKNNEVKELRKVGRWSFRSICGHQIQARLLVIFSNITKYLNIQKDTLQNCQMHVGT